MGFDHSINSEAVWQLELRRDAGQSTAIFREVRLPRSISVAYPRNPFALADEWAKRSMMYTALIEQELVGYICLVERGMDFAGLCHRPGGEFCETSAGCGERTAFCRAGLVRCKGASPYNFGDPVQKPACHPPGPEVRL